MRKVCLMALCLFCISIISGCKSGKYIAAGLYSSRAQSALARDNKEEALLEFERVIKVYPDSIWAQRALYIRGYTLNEMKKYKPAEIELKKLVDSYPDSTFYEDALFCLGNIYMATGDYLSSQNEFTRIIKKKSNPELVKKSMAKLDEIKKWFISRRDKEKLVEIYEKYREASRTHASLIMKIATGNIVEPEVVHRAFENVRQLREEYEKQLSGKEKSDTINKIEKARKKYISSYEKYINLVRDLTPDEYDRLEIHEALEGYQKNKKIYMDLKNPPNSTGQDQGAD